MAADVANDHPALRWDLRGDIRPAHQSRKLRRGHVEEKEIKRNRYITYEGLEAVRAVALLENDSKPTPSGVPIVALIDFAYQTAQCVGKRRCLSAAWKSGVVG
ncbi:hypothetical protein [Cupriavidus metallidurans]|uniref:hypothetical protein n=1 Tax=Cupriavidus metallidurans TaxID=119219 RepID=UPI001CCC1075|nr:hypothetical protein [Cupriavidus metallidurans]UBM11744.1 hypothetical protein LAI70_15520 [Cupriavidus metallidurans]